MAELYQPAVELEEEPMVMELQATSPATSCSDSTSPPTIAATAQRRAGVRTPTTPSSRTILTVRVRHLHVGFLRTDQHDVWQRRSYNWAWTTGGAPDAYFGDRTDKRQSGANNQYTTYDSLFSSVAVCTKRKRYGMGAAISKR